MTDNKTPTPEQAVPVDTTQYTSLATEIKAIFDKMYVAIKKGKAFRLGSDEVHNLMLRVSALGEEAEVSIKLGIKDAEAFVEKIVNPPVANKKLKELVKKEITDGNNSTESQSQGQKPTEGTANTDTTSVPAAK